MMKEQLIIKIIRLSNKHYKLIISIRMIDLLTKNNNPITEQKRISKNQKKTILMSFLSLIKMIKENKKALSLSRKINRMISN